MDYEDTEFVQESNSAQYMLLVEPLNFLFMINITFCYPLHQA
jgi:hypothetical protein